MVSDRVGRERGHRDACSGGRALEGPRQGLEGLLRAHLHKAGRPRGPRSCPSLRGALQSLNFNPNDSWTWNAPSDPPWLTGRQTPHALWTERQRWERPAEGAGALAAAARVGYPGWERVEEQGSREPRRPAADSGRG